MVVAVVPLKALERAKGRLAAVLTPVERAAVVRRLAERVLSACLEAPAVERVLVIAGDHAAAALARRPGVEVAVQTEAGLGHAVRHADRMLAGAPATLVVAADLPHLTAEDVERVSAAGAAPGPCVVVAPTADGGTGALLRRPGQVIAPVFGPGSATVHLALAAEHGVPGIRLELPNLALDVDTPEDLAALGADWLAGAGGPTLARPIEPGRDVAMPQGTIKHFDLETSTGSLVLDSQEELPFDAETFAASGLIELRVGQRVRFEISDEGERRRIRALRLVSL